MSGYFSLNWNLSQLINPLDNAIFDQLDAPLGRRVRQAIGHAKLTQALEHQLDTLLERSLKEDIRYDQTA